VPGANSHTWDLRATVGDEVEFDFDSDPGDIAAGATAIAPDFVQGTPPQVTGTILDAGGVTVIEATVTCAAHSQAGSTRITGCSR
jgi:hypothetical protein